MDYSHLGPDFGQWKFFALLFKQVTEQQGVSRYQIAKELKVPVSVIKGFFLTWRPVFRSICI